MRIEWIFEDAIPEKLLVKPAPTTRLSNLAKLNTFPPKAIFKAIPELKRLAKKLIPAGRRDRTLIPDIKMLIDRIETAKAINISLDTKTFSEKALSKKMKLNVYRVIQEQLANIAKFSQATEASISLGTTDRKITLDIRDNGKPIDFSERKRGICVTDILVCAEMNDGHASLKAEPGMGSHLHVEFYLRSSTTRTPRLTQTRSMQIHPV